MASATSSTISRPNAAALQSAFDTGIWYHLCLWPALKVAVENSWGGANSAEKRDWFAGAVSDLFNDRPETDQLDLETVLLQVMQDEFDVNVEDESEVPIATAIMKLRVQVSQGDLSGVEAAKSRWENRKGKAERVNVVENKDGEDEEESDEDDEEDEDEEGDVAMDDAVPQLAPLREKVEPEIDEDGFQKVVSKKRR